MNDLEILVKSYLAAIGLTDISVRSGSGPISDVDLSGVMPVIAYQANMRSRIMLGIRPIDCRIVSDKRNLCLRFDGSVEITNDEAALRGISWLFHDLESFSSNLSILDEMTTRYISIHDGELPEQSDINDAMLIGYEEALSQYVNGLNNEPAQTVGMSR